MPQNSLKKVAVTSWSEGDGIAQVICDELAAIGYAPYPINPLKETPLDPDFIFSYGPYGYFLSLPERVARHAAQMPTFVHWNTEGIPDLKLPFPAVQRLSQLRSWVGRHQHGLAHDRSLFQHAPFSKLKNKMTRYRYVGDYYYAYQQGWLHVFADSSEVYAKIHTEHGLPTIAMPWGATARWYEDLQLERDIDVLWIGKRGSRRRSSILDQTAAALRQQGVNIHIADGEENPFIFDDERTHYLNRAKITLNITRTWYDDNFSRFAMAMPNRSLVVSEQMQRHCTAYKPNEHYVATEPEKLADSILYYLEHAAEREAMVERAYQFSTTEVTFKKTIETIMQEAERQDALRHGASSYAYRNA